MEQTFQFRDVADTAFKARLGFDGSSGSGKTWSALAVAHALGQAVFVIDTESDSALRYKRYFPNIKHLSLMNHHPQSYIAAITAAEKAGAEVIIVDSLSHAWVGTDGALALVDKASAKGGNSYTAWRDVTPMHNALVQKLISSTAHMIVTLRTKTEYVLEENDRGKKVPRKIGMAPVFRDGIEYEFDVMISLDAQHVGTVTKTRCPALDGERFIKPGKELGTILREWTESGVAVIPEGVAIPPDVEPPAEEPVAEPTPEPVNGRFPGLDPDFVRACIAERSRIGSDAYSAILKTYGAPGDLTDADRKRALFVALKGAPNSNAGKAEALAAQLTQEAA